MYSDSKIRKFFYTNLILKIIYIYIWIDKVLMILKHIHIYAIFNENKSLNLSEGSIKNKIIEC